MRFGLSLAALMSLGLATLGIRAEDLPSESAAPQSSFAPMPLTLSAQAPLSDSTSTASLDHPRYKGGRGLITLQGMSGMFLNPTSGTLDQGQFTVQYCLLVDKFDLNTVIGHGLMASYGVTDWLELGMFGTVAEINGVDRRILNDPIGVGGPIARVRLLKEHGAIPELSIGGMYVDGSAKGDLLYRAEGFIAASKSVDLQNDTFRSLRAHAGVRYVGRKEAPALPKGLLGAGDFSVVYGGLELELPYAFYLIGEISTNNILKNGGRDLPYAAGIQWKPNNVLGISLAYSNPELLGLKRALWFGIGLNFKF